MIDTRNRIEVMLNSIATATPIEDPRDRLEVFISAVADALANSGNTNDIEPRDRIEVLLDAIADAIGNAGLIVAESLSVTENGTYTAPEGKAYTPVTVNVPTTTIESLSVTENGTYTAPEGKSYTPVTVNVPLPTNAVLLKSLIGLPQNVAAFEDGANAPLNDLELSIVPIQDGTGDPSPENVRAISGWTEANVHNYSKNIFTMQEIATAWNFTYDAATNKISGGNSPRKEFYSKAFKPNTQYTLSFDYVGSNDHISFIGFLYSDGTSNNAQPKATERTHYTWTSTAGKDVVGIFKSYYQTALIDLFDFQVEEGTEATTYEPANPPMSISFGTAGTVYGGSLNVTTGVLTVTDANIASYDGETLPSTWISSMDVYSPEATPTTGAQVVYKLESPTTTQLTPVQIRSLVNDNNIYCDCGQITDCEYFAKGV